MHIIAESIPFKTNVSKLCKRTGIGRNNLVQYIKCLEDLRIVTSSYSGGCNSTKARKNSSSHPNLQYAISDEDVNIGTVRESFFINQLSAVGLNPFLEI
ncbi:hypothetical protein [Carboxylicivirga marina]|uniref:Uncharacterized protein n=1 Tax=Carboxylicivirga marina TaxID=2800988 RepID=A0ABS1HNT7_9BACT|nr:hypothetical protein [Carboxylicivirga marina]MBK3519260.1 hypothetical protein [Carboxylicivirga marina]